MGQRTGGTVLQALQLREVKDILRRQSQRRPGEENCHILLMVIVDVYYLSRVKRYHQSCAGYEI